jgi:S-DNA-T family DNA segregation ATPase FtsK/SpoIIIE
MEALIEAESLQPQLVLVDDAELVDDSSQAITRLLEAERRDVIVVAAGRIDALRSAYGHWTQIVRRQRRGVVLRPTSDLDGDVLGAALPRRETTPMAPGRGYLVVDGVCRLVQLAVPVREPSRRASLAVVGRTDIADSARARQVPARR